MTVSAPGPKATETDIQLLDTFRERLREDASSDNDRFGKPIDAYEAVKTLNRGGSIVFEHAEVGTVGKGRYPKRRRKIFPGRATRYDHAHAEKILRADNYRGEGVRVSSYTELRAMVAIEGYVKALGEDLTAPEKQAAAILRKLEGSSKLCYTVHEGRDDFGSIHHFTSDGVKPGEVRGLFDAEVDKGGFLGFGGHPDRLTAYEALCKLRDDKPVTIRTQGGERTVSCIDDLLLSDRLQ